MKHHSVVSFLLAASFCCYCNTFLHYSVLSNSIRAQEAQQAQLTSTANNWLSPSPSRTFSISSSFMSLLTASNLVVIIGVQVVSEGLLSCDRRQKRRSLRVVFATQLALPWFTARIHLLLLSCFNLFYLILMPWEFHFKRDFLHWR